MKAHRNEIISCSTCEREAAVVSCGKYDYNVKVGSMIYIIIDVRCAKLSMFKICSQYTLYSSVNMTLFKNDEQYLVNDYQTLFTSHE